MPGYIGSGNSDNSACEAELIRVEGMELLANGSWVSGSKIVLPTPEKSPFRSAKVGTDATSLYGLLFREP